MADPARTAALRALLQVEENAGYSNLVLDKALKAASLPQRDRAFASTLFYGVLERRLTLDYYLSQCLRDPGRKPAPAAMMAMRCGAYQIFYMDKVPDSAAVNESVESLKAVGMGKAAGLVNGVLRGLLRKKPHLSLPQGDLPRAWALRYSVPEPLIRLWMGAYGRDTAQKLLEAFSQKAALYLRANTAKTTPAALQARLEAEGAKATPLDAPSGALRLESGGSPTALTAFGEGLFHVQDLSAQWICAILAPNPGDTVCDCCAAPGGKTFTIAQQVGATGKVVALDLYKGRVGLIEKGAQRLGLTNIEARVHDAQKGFEGFPLFDRVLCDVPCSGFGVIRRKPEIRYKPLDSIKSLPTLQLSILENAAKAVKPGGRLVYSTCTLNPAENGRVALLFLQAHPEFAPAPFTLPGVPRLPGEPAHLLTLLPLSAASDGFFAAAFTRRQDLGALPQTPPGAKCSLYEHLRPWTAYFRFFSEGNCRYAP